MNETGQAVKKRILLIEDELDVCKSLAYRLKKVGFDVFISNDGEDGLKQAQEKIPDLIILDLMLPSMPGEEICKALRENDREEFQTIPIIMLTARTAESDRIIGKVIGANSYIMKPFDIDHLLNEINRCIK